LDLLGGDQARLTSTDVWANQNMTAFEASNSFFSQNYLVAGFNPFLFVFKDINLV